MLFLFEFQSNHCLCVYCVSCIGSHNSLAITAPPRAVGAVVVLWSVVLPSNEQLWKGFQSG